MNESPGLSDYAMPELKHWAINAFKQGAKDAFSESDVFNNRHADADHEVIRSAALAYELAATEWLEEGEHEQAGRACEILCRLQRLQEPPGWERPEEHIPWMLQEAAISVCAGNQSQQMWIKQREAWITAPQKDGKPWDEILLYGLFVAWKSILSGAPGKVREVVPVMTGLRKKQRIEEKRLIGATPEDNRRSVGWKLVGLYHAVHASDQLASALASNRPDERVVHHFQMAYKSFDRAIDEAGLLPAFIKLAEVRRGGVAEPYPRRKQ